MRKRPVAIAIVLILLIGACSSGASTTTTTEPETTSTTQHTTTTTRQQIVDGGLVPVDPATLIPLPGASSITQGDWFEGTVSPNGGWVALRKSLRSEQLWMEIVDLATSEVVAETRLPQGASGLQITDEGTAFWMSGGNRMTLFRLRAGASNREKVFDKFPEDFFTDAFQQIDRDRFGFFGLTSTDGQNQGEASIVVLDAWEGSLTQVALPGLDMGIIGRAEPIGDVESLEIANPVAVWDTDNNRVLIVEASRDVITEVNLATGEITEHRWTRPEAFLERLWAFFIPRALAKGLTKGTTRDAVLSTDGDLLYVATRTTVIDEDKEVSSPLDLVVLDTGTWAAAVIDANVDTLYPSPDGVFLLAQGVDVVSGGAGVRASPVYVIDMSSGELLIGFQTSDTSGTNVSFSRDSGEAYITTWSEQEMKIDILDLGLMQLTGSVAFRELSIVGEAGLMAFHFNR